MLAVGDEKNQINKGIVMSELETVKAAFEAQKQQLTQNVHEIRILKAQITSHKQMIDELTNGNLMLRTQSELDNEYRMSLENEKEDLKKRLKVVSDKLENELIKKPTSDQGDKK